MADAVAVLVRDRLISETTLIVAGHELALQGPILPHLLRGDGLHAFKDLHLAHFKAALR